MSINNVIGIGETVRNFNIVAFADDLTEDTLSDFLQSTGSQSAFILHGADVSNGKADSESGLDVGNNLGTHKKPHYHISFRFDGKKSLASIEKLLEPIAFAIQHIQLVNPKTGGKEPHLYVEQTQSSTSLDRYFLHLDHPDKTPYQASFVRTFGGYVFDTRRSLTDTQKEYLLLEVFDLIDSYGIDTYKTLIASLRAYKPEYVSIAVKNCYALKTYIHEAGSARVIPLGDKSFGSN